MPLLPKFLARLFSPLGGILAASAAVLALVVSFASSQQQVGAAKAVNRQEKINADATRKAASAGARSVDPAAGGVLNPYYRQD